MENIQKTIKTTSIIFGIITAVDFIYGMFYYKSFISNGLNTMDISLLMSLSSISLLIFDFPSGNISDHIGRKKSAGIGIILWGIGLYFFSISKFFIHFAISIILFSLGIALESGSLQAWLHTYLSKKDKLNLWNDAVSYISFNKNFIKFFLNGIFLGLASILKFNLLSISGIILIFLGIYTLIWNKNEENYGTKKNLNIAILDNFKYIFKKNYIQKLTIIKLLSSIFLTSFLLIFPYRFTTFFNLDKELLPYTYFLLNFVMFFSSYLYKNFLSKKFEIYNIYISNIFIGAFSLIMILFSTNIYLFFIGIICFEIFFIINITTFSIFQFDYLSDENKSAMLSVLSSIGSLSSSILFIIIGFLLKNVKYMFIISILIIIMSLMIIITTKNLQKTKINTI